MPGHRPADHSGSEGLARPEGGVCSPECTFRRQGWQHWPLSTLQGQGVREKGYASVSPQARAQGLDFPLVRTNGADLRENF